MVQLTFAGDSSMLAKVWTPLPDELCKVSTRRSMTMSREHHRRSLDVVNQAVTYVNYISRLTLCPGMSPRVWTPVFGAFCGSLAMRSMTSGSRQDLLWQETSWARAEHCQPCARLQFPGVTTHFLCRGCCGCLFPSNGNEWADTHGWSISRDCNLLAGPWSILV